MKPEKRRPGLVSDVHDMVASADDCPNMSKMRVGGSGSDDGDQNEGWTDFGDPPFSTADPKRLNQESNPRTKTSAEKLDPLRQS